MQKSHLEQALLWQIKAAGLPDPSQEHVFDANKRRRFRFDFAWVPLKIAVEVQGGQWIRGGGRHQRATALDSEYTKLNLATEQGWRVYLFTSTMIVNGTAVTTLERVLNAKENQADEDAA